jgi:hypothetical protein
MNRTTPIKSLTRDVLERQLEETRAYAHALTCAFTDVVGGGSEMFGGRILRDTPLEMYKADIPFCTKRIRDRFTMLHDMINKAEAAR